MRYLWRRIGATVIDLSVISMFMEIVFKLFGGFLTLAYTNIVADFIRIVLYLVLCIIISIGYSFICFRFFKYPLGKLLMNLKVLNENSERPETKVYLYREYNKYLYIYASVGLYLPYQFIIYVLK